MDSCSSWSVVCSAERELPSLPQHYCSDSRSCPFTIQLYSYSFELSVNTGGCHSHCPNVNAESRMGPLLVLCRTQNNRKPEMYPQIQAPGENPDQSLIPFNSAIENSGKNLFNFPREIMQELDSSQNDTEFQRKSPNWAGGDSTRVP